MQKIRDVNNCSSKPFMIEPFGKIKNDYEYRECVNDVTSYQNNVILSILKVFTFVL
jgi:hypothetical protein